MLQISYKFNVILDIFVQEVKEWSMHFYIV